MKKLTSILLIIAFFLNIIGVYPIFKLLQFQIRKEIKNTIKNNIASNELHEIVITAKNCNELKWERLNKEFFYKGNMYDIVRVKKIGKAIHYLCVNDKEEKQLFFNLDSLVKISLKKGKYPLKNTIKRILKALSQIVILVHKITFIFNKYAHNSNYLLNFITSFRTIVFQPPQQNYLSLL